MHVVIKKAGLYNDRRHRAAWCEAGETLETTTSYGKSLIDDGFAEAPRQAQAPHPVASEPVPDTADDVPFSALDGDGLSIYELDLSGRIIAALEEAGYISALVLREASDTELLAISGIGNSSIEDIRAALEG
jgi:DNA-directed RNA polymerase alpha subunit